MAKLFKRAVVIQVDDVQVKDLRVTFRVHKTIGKEPNTCVAAITNLKRDTRARLKSKGAFVSLFAGYDGRVQQIFSGDARRITHVHERPEWTTKIECGDGETAFLFGRVSESFKAGTRWRDVVRKVALQVARDPGNVEAQLSDVQDVFLHGYSAQGRAAGELDRLLKGRNLEWSVQDGRLQVLGPSDTNTDGITVLTPDTGLIGSPEFAAPKEKGGPDVLRVKTLLQGQLRPGGKFRVDSQTVPGLFKAVEVTHEGDTGGDQFYTELEGVAIAR
jgi:hypothetical protein